MEQWANGVSVELPIDHSNSIVLTVESMIYGFEQRNIWSGNVYYILSSKRFLVTIDYTRPYLWLPDDICDNFERFFGLTYNETSNQYMINATAHHDNKQRNATVTLKMGSGRSANHHTTKIDLPYDAFNLEVKTPVDDNATRYFPLKRSLNGKYILGRTFLQESYLIVDYERGNFTIAPAAYNDPMPDSIIVPIKDFKRYPVRPVLTRRASFKDKGISAGAIAGLVVGLIAVVIITALGIRFWQKRRLANRKARSYTETMIMGTAVVGNEVKHRRISEFDSQSYAIGGSYGNDRDSKALELVSPINEMDNPPTEPYYSPASYSEDLDCFSASTKYERRTSERRSFAQNTPYEHKAKKELITGKDNVGHPHYIGSPKKQDTLTKTYPDIESLLKGLRENGDISNESSVSLRFDCELEAIVGSLKIQQCADIKAAISNALCNHVVIISSDQSTRGTRIEAVTCIAFAKRRWGLLGEQLLKFISRLCAEGHQEYGKRLLCGK
ncbi:hypothetical protein SLS60_009681 [Paraconiothyrium brasiliense]|uniref:Peptidase A1 domain-containing protein n=1 Tax=Paraconiothyrium brasiliense TaxID=300254 RepID=A0ABR3QUZ5_9PLEO